MKNIIYILSLLFILSSCASQKRQGATDDSRYKRKPIVEVSEDDLKCEAAQMEATVQQLVGKTEEAIEQYHKILSGRGNYAPAHYELGKIYLSKGWTDSALYHTKMALSRNPDNYWYEHQLAKIYERMQDGKNLTATWEDIVKRHPEKPENYYDLSNAYLMANDITSSIEVLDRVERKFGISEPVSLQKQKLWSAINRHDKARKELEKLAEAVPSETGYSAILAESYMGEKNYAKALQYYYSILKATPNDENIHISIASCYLSMNNMDSTFVHLQAGVRNPSIDCHHKLLYLTEFLRNRSFFGTYNKACFALADDLAGHCNGETNHHFLYGQMLAAQERYAEAAAQFAQHIENDKSQYEAWDALLICESMVSDTSASLLEHALQASELFPLNARPYIILAQGYNKLGDCEKAKLYIQRCLMVAPNNAGVKQLDETIKQSCE